MPPLLPRLLFGCTVSFYDALCKPSRTSSYRSLPAQSSQIRMPGNGSKSARRSCMLCGEVFRQSSLRIVSVNKQQNAVLVTLLLVSHSFEAEFLKNIYNKVIGVKKYVCHCHHVDAVSLTALIFTSNMFSLASFVSSLNPVSFYSL